MFDDFTCNRFKFAENTGNTDTIVAVFMYIHTVLLYVSGLTCLQIWGRVSAPDQQQLRCWKS